MSEASTPMIESCAFCAKKSGAVVIGIDYTLSPEAKYPQAIEECVAVSQFFLQHGPDYGIDSQNMGYAGDSAGAYLSLASYLWQRDTKMDTGYIKGMLLYTACIALKTPAPGVYIVANGMV